jgi:hypothetical protein
MQIAFTGFSRNDSLCGVYMVWHYTFPDVFLKALFNPFPTVMVRFQRLFQRKGASSISFLIIAT